MWLVSLQENFAEVEIFELQMRTERKIFFRPILFVSPLCPCPMRKISLATSEKCEWKSGFIGLQAKKTSVSCSEFQLVRNGLTLSKLRFSADSQSSYTNVSISRELGNVTLEKQSNVEVEESSFTANVFVITQN